MEAELYGWELVEQYEKIIGGIAEWRTNIYSILNLVSWKKQISPRMQSDIVLIHNALMLPSNYDIGDFALEQVSQMINFKSLFDQLIFSHKQLIDCFRQLLSIELVCELEQKTGTLMIYFDYSQQGSQMMPIHLAASLNLQNHQNNEQLRESQNDHNKVQKQPNQSHQYQLKHKIVSLTNLDSVLAEENSTTTIPENNSSPPNQLENGGNPLKTSLEQVSTCSTWASINSFTNCGDTFIEIE